MACQGVKEETAAGNQSEEEETEVHTSGEIDIEGVADHYHTGDTIELAAVPSDEVDYDHWQWHTKEGEHSDWEVASGQENETFTGEAVSNGLENQSYFIQ